MASILQPQEMSNSNASSCAVQRLPRSTDFFLAIIRGGHPALDELKTFDDSERRALRMRVYRVAPD
jgi:hypothetical protein